MTTRVVAAQPVRRTGELSERGDSNTSCKLIRRVDARPVHVARVAAAARLIGDLSTVALYIVYTPHHDALSQRSDATDVISATVRFKFRCCSDRPPVSTKSLCCTVDASPTRRPLVFRHTVASLYLQLALLLYFSPH